MNYDKIESVTQFNILGIVLSSNLKWNKHTDHIGLWRLANGRVCYSATFSCI